MIAVRTVGTARQTAHTYTCHLRRKMDMSRACVIHVHTTARGFRIKLAEGSVRWRSSGASDVEPGSSTRITAGVCLLEGRPQCVSLLPLVRIASGACQK